MRCIISPGGFLFPGSERRVVPMMRDGASPVRETRLDRVLNARLAENDYERNEKVKGET